MALGGDEGGWKELRVTVTDDEQWRLRILILMITV